MSTTLALFSISFDVAPLSLLMVFSRLSGGLAVDSKGLFLPVRQGPPKPLEWAKAEMLQPNGADHKIDGPNQKHDAVKLIALKFAKEPKAIEQNAAKNGSENVVRECHATDRGQLG